MTCAIRRLRCLSHRLLIRRVPTALRIGSISSSRTERDEEKLQALVPEPLIVEEPLVRYEFIRMPDSTGFGDYTESGQVIPVSFLGRKGTYTHCMFLNDHPPIAGGRELWGFPKKLANPTLRTEIDMLIGTLEYGGVRVATCTMGYKYGALDANAVRISLGPPTSCSKSCRTWTARHAFASWSNIISRISSSKAHGPAREHCRSRPMHSRPLPSCQFLTWSPPSTLSLI